MICRSIDAQPNQINLARRLRWGIMFAVIMLAYFQGYAQRQSTIPDDLFKNPKPADEIFIYNANGPLFWEPYLKEKKTSLSRRYESLVQTHHGLYYLVEGTGRIYRIDREGKFTRVDSTKLTGYNNGAYVFSYKDTIYSLGGYGFWRYSGHLRFFRYDYNHEWEIKPLNRELPMLMDLNISKWSLWLDKNHNNIIYPEIVSYRNMITKISITDTCKVWKLDLNTKKWSILGTLNKETASVISNCLRIISLPWGELILTEDFSPNLALLDYRTNQFKALDIKKTIVIRSFIQQAERDNSRLFIYTRDSTLTFHVSEQRKLVLHLTHKDFRSVGKTIFKPYKKPISIYGIEGVPLGAMVVGLFLFMVSLWMFYGSYQLTAKSKKVHTLMYDSNEASLIRAMISHPEHTLSAEEVNVLLGTSKKSLDVQRKNRSEIIVSINKKYQAITGQSDLLIAQKRAENDKRLVNYFLDPVKHQYIKEALPTEH